MKAIAITLKGISTDQNGLKEIIWATQAQVDAIAKLRNNPETRYNFIKLGRYTFSPMDILYMEEKEKDHYELPKYFLDRVTGEKEKLLGDGRK